MAGPAWWVGESHPLGNHKGNSGKESEKLSQGTPHAKDGREEIKRVPYPRWQWLGGVQVSPSQEAIIPVQTALCPYNGV